MPQGAKPTTLRKLRLPTHEDGQLNRRKLSSGRIHARHLKLYRAPGNRRQPVREFLEVVLRKSGVMPLRSAGSRCNIRSIRCVLLKTASRYVWYRSCSRARCVSTGALFSVPGWKETPVTGRRPPGRSLARRIVRKASDWLGKVGGRSSGRGDGLRLPSVSKFHGNPTATNSNCHEFQAPQTICIVTPLSVMLESSWWVPVWHNGTERVYPGSGLVSAGENSLAR